MECECGAKAAVTDSRTKPDGSTWRRRRCTKCELRFTTSEYRVTADYKGRPMRVGKLDSLQGLEHQLEKVLKETREKISATKNSLKAY